MKKENILFLILGAFSGITALIIWYKKEKMKETPHIIYGKGYKL